MADYFPLFFFLTTLTSIVHVKACWGEEGWTLYMINGKEAQYKSVLRYGANPDGYGNLTGTSTTAIDTGAYKMSEEVFDSYQFKEVMATDTTTCSSWLKIEKVDGSIITASEAFAVDSIDTGITVTRDDGSVKTFGPYAGDDRCGKGNTLGTRNHGPFYHDAFGSCFAWMWTDYNGISDDRKGTIFGTGCDACEPVTNYAWIWYGRGPTVSPTISPSHTPSIPPTKFPTDAPTISPTEIPTKQPSLPPTDTPTFSPTTSPSVLLTRVPTSPTNDPTEVPTSSPTNEPTEVPTSSPTNNPTKIPSVLPTESPTEHPTNHPTMNPTPMPSKNPTSFPTEIPSLFPTKRPTISPSSPPTTFPTETPNISPTEIPTKQTSIPPTETPTASPSTSRGVLPTEAPTNSPTNDPTKIPTIIPTESPTEQPSMSITLNPTTIPSQSPSLIPTHIPTSFPTRSPTDQPSFFPTTQLPTEVPTWSDFFAMTSPESSNIFSIGEPISILWMADDRTSEFVDIQLCLNVSDGTLECFDQGSGVISTSNYLRNDGSEIINLLEDPRKGCGGWYTIKISDSYDSNIFSLSEYFQIELNTQTCKKTSTSSMGPELFIPILVASAIIGCVLFICFYKWRKTSKLNSAVNPYGDAIVNTVDFDQENLQPEDAI